MNQFQGRVFVRVLASAAGAVAICTALASDPPDSKANPVSGYIEVTDSTHVGSNYDVRHAINPGNGQQLSVTMVSSDPLDDLSPRIAISLSGDTWIVWYRDGSTREVLIRKRTYAAGTWGSEQLVSLAGESSRSPEMVHDGARPWVAYEYATQNRTGIGVVQITDGPLPFPSRVPLATTTYAGDVDVRVNAEAGQLWVTWVDSTQFVGWSEYSYGTATWGLPGYESYASDSIQAARDRIRSTVLTN